MAIFAASRPVPMVATNMSAPAQGGGDPPPPSVLPAGTGGAAAASSSPASTPEWWATFAGLGLFVVGLVVAVWQFDEPSGPSYQAAEGIGAFALFYVVAQAVERFVEMAVPWETVPKVLSGSSKSELEHARDVAVAGALALVEEPTTEPSTQRAAAEDAAAKQAAVNQSRANRTTLTFGLSGGLGMVLCGYLEADFLSSVGVNFGEHPGNGAELVMMAVTGLVIAAGSKQLHDTISSISKSSAQKSTPAATSGNS